MQRKEKIISGVITTSNTVKKMAELHTYTGNVSGQTIFMITDEFAVNSNFQNYIWFKIKKVMVISLITIK